MNSPSPRDALPDAFAQTRKSILGQLGDWENQEAWNRFHQTYWRVIYAFARESGLTNEEAMDVVQETVLSVAKQFRDGRFNHDAGTFKSWLRNLTRWRIADQFRKRKREIDDAPHRREADDRSTMTFDQFADKGDQFSQEAWDREWRRNALAVACQNLRGQVSPRQYQIFDCYALQEWDVGRVCRELGVNAAQVYLTKHRLQKILRKELQSLENDPSF
jgi:RNA polymerase sigma-70 factor (ECF subfamily)